MLLSTTYMQSDYQTCIMHMRICGVNIAVCWPIFEISLSVSNHLCKGKGIISVTHVLGGVLTPKYQHIVKLPR